MDLRNFFVATVARGDDGGALQLVAVEGESEVRVGGKHHADDMADCLADALAPPQPGKKRTVVVRLTVTAIKFTTVPTAAATRVRRHEHDDPGATDRDVWTMGGVETTPEDVLRAHLFHGCVGCAARTPTVGGVVQICQRRECSLGSGRLFHRLCIAPVSVVVKDTQGRVEELPVQWGSGPSHKTLEVLMLDAASPSLGALCNDADAVRETLVARIRQLLTSSHPLRVRVAVLNSGDALASKPGIVAVIENFATYL